MIFYILFLFLFIFFISFILVFLFGIMLPAMKAEKIGIHNPVFSTKEIQYIEKNSDIKSKDLTKRAQLKEEKTRKDEGGRRLVFDGLKNCSLFFSTYESEYSNSVPCAGFGDCMPVCRQNAISIKDGAAVIDNMCIGCGECIYVCPRKFISLVPAVQNNDVEMKKGFKFWYSCYRMFVKRS